MLNFTLRIIKKSDSAVYGYLAREKTMEVNIRQSLRNEVIGIVAIYSLFGGLWIYLSDNLLGMLVHDPVLLSRISMYKGLLFITLTATLLYFLIARFMTRLSSKIAELNQAYHLLAQQRAFLDIIIEGTTDAVYVKDAGGRYLLANSAVSRFVNKPLDEIIGHDDKALFPLHEAEALMAQDQWVMTQSSPQTYEEHLTTTAGEVFFSSTKGAVRDPEGTVEGIFGIARDITKRKKIETELQIATISINSIADAVYWLLADGKIWRVNNAASTMLGYSQEEFCNLSVTDLDPNFPTSLWNNHWLELQQLGSVSLETTHRTKDGRTIPVEVSANYIVFEGKEFNCATVRDISDRKHAEMILKQEQLFASKVLESLPGIFYLYTYPELRLELWNKNHETLLGFGSEEMNGRSLYDWHLPENKGAIAAAIEVVMEQGQSDAEAPLLAKDGTLVPFHLTGVRFESEGSLYLIGIGIDISERLRVEKALDERNRLVDTLLAHLPVGVFMVEAPSGKPLIANGKALELLGRGILPDASKENLTEVYEAYKFGTSVHYPVEEMPIVRGMYGESSTIDDLIVVRPDGTSKLLEISGTPVLDANGHPWASLVCFQDITGRKEEETQALRIEKLESLGVLAGGIAHDFNNILTGIMGNISYAQLFVDVSHKAYTPLVEAEKASVRARELSHQLLTFARGGEPVKKEVSVRKLVNESISLVLRGSNVKGAIDIPESIQTIEADEGQITQVFHNIILNATQAMPGGGTLTVTGANLKLDALHPLSLPAGDYVTLSFTDEGCGISADQQKKIFDPYFTTKSAGTGLGLASVHSILLRHGGAIDVSSSIGHGTTFTIYLPSTGKTGEMQESAAADQVVGTHSGGSILVMDDEEVIQELSSEMLHYLGYDTTCCSNGSDAVTIYREAMGAGTPFSAVIMDLTIPGGMGGKETARQILEIDPDACLIVSSGYSNDPIMADYKAFGFSGAVSKPYSMMEFSQAMSSLLSPRTGRSARAS